jgi:hypothetical protein
MPDNTTTPPDWVLLEAAKRCGWTPDLTWLRADYRAVNGSFRALCDMIERYEQPPVDRKVLCAVQAISHGSPTLAEAATEREINHCVRAIELWEEGFGK